MPKILVLFLIQIPNRTSTLKKSLRQYLLYTLKIFLDKLFLNPEKKYFYRSFNSFFIIKFTSQLVSILLLSSNSTQNVCKFMCSAGVAGFGTVQSSPLVTFANISNFLICFFARKRHSLYFNVIFFNLF